MLTTSRTSRRRLTTSAASVAALVVAGLGLTASGTRAAATVSERIETATGLALQTAVPPAPPASPAPAASDVKKVRRVVVVKDGKPSIYEGAEADRYIAANPVPVPPTPPVPRAGAAPAVPSVPVPPVNITSARCGADTGKKTFVITRREGSANATVICTDRIEAAAQAGQLTPNDSEAIQRQAMTGALESLRATRASMAANASIPAADRAEAVAQIDASIRELQGEIADVGKN